MKVFISLLVAMLYVGCSNIGTGVIGSVSPENGTAVVTVKIDLPSLGGMGKTLAREDTLFVLMGSGTQAEGPIIREDTILLASNEAEIQYANLSEKGSYWIYTYRGNGTFDFNSGGIDFVVPEDVDTFPLAVDCGAKVTKLKLTFSLKGTNLCSLSIKRTLVPSGGAAPFSRENKMSVAGKDTAIFSDYLGVGYAWVVAVTGYSCSSAAYCDGMLTTPVLVGSQNYSSVPLVLSWHDDTKAVAKVLVTMEDLGEYSVPVSILSKRRI